MMDGAMMMKYDWWDEWCMKWRWGMIRWKMLGWMHEMGWWWWNMMLWYDGANALPEPTPSPSHYYTWPSNKEPCASRKHIRWKTGTFPFHVCMRRHLPRHGPSVYRPIHLGTSKKNYSHEGLIQPVGLQWLSNIRFCRHMNHAQDDMTLIEGLFASQVCSNIARMYSLASSSKCPA